MNKTLLSLAVLLSQNLPGQISVVNLSQSNSDSAVIYAGVPNRIQVKGITNPVQLVATKSVMLDTPALNTFSVRPPFDDSVETFNIYIDKKLIVTKVFKIYPSPDPAPQLGDITTGIATAREIIHNRMLRVVFNNSSYKGLFSILSFVIYIEDPSGATLYSSIESDQNFLSTAQIDLIRSLKSGYKIRFDDILMTGQNSRVRRLHDFYIVIK